MIYPSERDAAAFDYQIPRLIFRVSFRSAKCFDPDLTDVRQPTSANQHEPKSLLRLITDTAERRYCKHNYH